jgi:hypothetical protein
MVLVFVDSGVNLLLTYRPRSKLCSTTIIGVGPVIRLIVVITPYIICRSITAKAQPQEHQKSNIHARDDKPDEKCNNRGRPIIRQ